MSNWKKQVVVFLFFSFFTIGISLYNDYVRLVVKGDCLAFISKIKEEVPNNVLRFFVSSIFHL